MTRKKKTIIAISVSFVLMITTVGIGFTFVAGSHGFRSMGHGGFHRGMPSSIKKEVAEFILWRLEKEADALNLSQTQKEAFDEFRNTLEQTVQTGMDTRMELRAQTLSEFEKETPELSDVINDIQVHVSRMSDMVEENLELFNIFYNTLDDDQQKRITDGIKDKIEAHKPYCRNNYTTEGES